MRIIEDGKVVLREYTLRRFFSAWGVIFMCVFRVCFETFILAYRLCAWMYEWFRKKFKV